MDTEYSVVPHLNQRRLAYIQIYCPIRNTCCIFTHTANFNPNILEVAKRGGLVLWFFSFRRFKNFMETLFRGGPSARKTVV